jgi:hypothetical protein
MKLLREFLEPIWGKIVALIAFFAALLQLVSFALPELPDFIKYITWVFLGIVVIYVLYFLIISFGQQFYNLIISRLGTELTNQLMVKFVPKLEEIHTAALAQRPIEDQSYEYYAKRYGFGYDLVEVDCFINHDGSAIVQRKIQVKAYATLKELDTFLLIPETHPQGQPRDISFTNIRSLTPDWNVTLGDIRKELGGRLSASVIIAPSLNSEQSIVYEMTEQLPANLYAINQTMEELEKRETPYDYFGWNINRPTAQFYLRVHFPGFQSQFIPEIYSAEVRYASASGFPSIRKHHQETSYLRGPFMKESEGGRHVCTLEINYPVIGLIYSMRWQPIGRK